MHACHMRTVPKKVLGQPLANKLRVQLRAAVEADGIPAVAERLGVNRHTVTRALAELGLYPATAMLIEIRLTEKGAAQAGGSR